jgi:hypothetical protein
MDATVIIPKRAPRAVRNNNPGNIRVGDPWQGLMKPEAMTPDQASEKDFCVFQSPKWGFRAIARVLISYKDKYGIETIAGAITRWAPPRENDTAAYIKHVAELVQQAADLPLDFHSFQDLRPLCKAIAIHENEAWLFEDEDLDTGLRLAGVEPPVTNLASSRTIKSAAAGISATAVIEVVNQVQPALSTIGQIKEYAPHVAVAVLVIVLVAIVVFRIQDWQRARR